MLQKRGFTATLLAVTGLSALLLGPLSAVGEENARGAELYNLCSQCHGENGEGNSRFLAPAIAGLSEWYIAAQVGHFKSGARGFTYDDWKGMRMRPMALALMRDGDVEAVSKYVADLPDPKVPAELEGGDPERGKVLYGVCVACHGAQGEGIQALNGPALAGTSDWYIADSLRRYKQGTRGANPANPNGAIMRGMVGSLTTDQAILDVVAYISTLSGAAK